MSAGAEGARQEACRVDVEGMDTMVVEMAMNKAIPGSGNQVDLGRGVGVLRM